MLYETQNHPFLLLVFVGFGFLSGVFFDVFDLLKFLCANKKITNNIFDFFAVIGCFFIYFFVNLNFNYGDFRLFAIIVFLLGLFLQRISLGKLFAKCKNACYNWFNKITKLILAKFDKQQKRTYGEHQKK